MIEKLEVKRNANKKKRDQFNINYSQRLESNQISFFQVRIVKYYNNN